MSWSYLKSTLVGEEQIGPLSNAEFIEEIRANHIKKKTKICSTEVTNGQWVEASTVPKIAATIDKVTEEARTEKQREKAAAKAHANQQQIEASRQAAADKQRREAERNAQKESERRTQLDQTRLEQERLASPLGHGQLLTVIRDQLYRTNKHLQSISSNLTVIAVILVLWTLITIGGCVMTLGGL